MDQRDRYLRQLWRQPSCGLGCVIVPPDVDRDTYINRCLTTETVSIQPQVGGMSFNNVPISVEALQHIEFPEGSEIYGSAVVFLFHPLTDKPIIVAVFSKKTGLFGVDWKQFKLFKGFKDNYVSVVGDGSRGNLYVTVTGTEGDSGGQIYISICEPSNKGRLTVSVQGNVELIHNNLSMTCLTTKIASKDSFEVQTDTAIIGAESKVSLGKENYEPVVLGNKLKDILSNLIDAISALTVPTAVGPSGPPVNVAQFIGIKNQLSNILSNKVETE